VGVGAVARRLPRGIRSAPRPIGEPWRFSRLLWVGIPMRRCRNAHPLHAPARAATDPLRSRKPSRAPAPLPKHAPRPSAERSLADAVGRVRGARGRRARLHIDGHRLGVRLGRHADGCGAGGGRRVGGPAGLGSGLGSGRMMGWMSGCSQVGREAGRALMGARWGGGGGGAAAG